MPADGRWDLTRRLRDLNHMSLSNVFLSRDSGQGLWWEFERTSKILGDMGLQMCRQKELVLKAHKRIHIWQEQSGKMSVIVLLLSATVR
jgi:hypothetical protein